MRPLFPDPRRPRGWTLIELMIVVGVLGIIMPVTIRFFSKASEGMAADEMHMHLKKVNQETLLRLNVRVKSNKHMFRNDTSGVTFLGCVLNSTTAPPPAAALPVTLPGTQPDTATLGSELVPTFSIARGAAPASFGNQLFFAAYDSPGTILFNGLPQTFMAPMTVVSKAGGTPVTYGAANGSGPATIILDVYRFYRYYPATSVKPLTTVKDGPTAAITSGAIAYGLVEWRSVQFVDFNQLSSINTVDTTLRGRVVQWLSKSTAPTNFPGAPITLAYDPSQTDPATAFYNLNFAAGTYTAMATPRIPQASWSILTKAASGILSGGFRYGIAPNTAGWRNAPPSTAAVPQYATASTTYPGGFEVGLIGSSAGVQVLTRSLLVARGAVRQTIYNDLTMVHNAKDAW